MPEPEITPVLNAIATAMADERITVAGRSHAPLLPRPAEDLIHQWERRLSALVRDPVTGAFIAHATLEHLTGSWHELGGVWVHPEYRGRSSHHPHVGRRLYRHILAAHAGKDILTTTTNPAAMVVGARNGMVPVSYRSLPPAVWQATCVCPFEKTGVAREQNVPRCRIKEEFCFVQVAAATFARNRSLERVPLPFVVPDEASVSHETQIDFVLPAFA